MHRLRSRPRLLLGAPLAILASLATACGGSAKASSSATSATTAPPAASASFAAARAKFTSCLETHGVPANVASSGFGFGFGRRPPTSTTTPADSSASSSVPTSRPTIPSQYQAALRTCRSDLPTGGRPGGGFNSPALAAYRNCLQVHGVTLPTAPPTSAGSTAPAPTGGGLSALRNSPAFRAAQQACQSLLPARSGPGSASTSTTAGSGA